MSARQQCLRETVFYIDVALINVCIFYWHQVERSEKVCKDSILAICHSLLILGAKMYLSLKGVVVNLMLA